MPIISFDRWYLVLDALGGDVVMLALFSWIMGALEHLFRVPVGESTSIAITGFIDIHSS